MLQLVLFIVAIGLVLYLWERFSAFKWILAAIVGLPLLFIVVTEIAQHQRTVEKEKQEIAEQSERLASEKKAEIEHIDRMIDLHKRSLATSNDPEFKKGVTQLIEELEERKALQNENQ